MKLLQENSTAVFITAVGPDPFQIYRSALVGCLVKQVAHFSWKARARAFLLPFYTHQVLKRVRGLLQVLRLIRRKRYKQYGAIAMSVEVNAQLFHERLTRLHGQVSPLNYILFASSKP